MVHDFRNLSFSSDPLPQDLKPDGLDSYFEEIAALGARSEFSEARLHAVPLNYDGQG